MPKAWIAEELRPDMAISHGAALMLRVKLPEVMHYQAAAAAGRINGIHDMRVASKRLREAVRVLRPALPHEARRKLLPVVEELNDALGEVRDRDVMRQAFAAMVKAEPRWNLQAVRKQLGKERRLYHRKLLAVFAALAKSDFTARYDQLMDELEQAPAAGQEQVGHYAATAIGERLQDVMDNLHTITGRHRAAQFHRQRIRVKKLKYALEPFIPILAGEADELYVMVSDLQELMGQVHDVDVQRALIKGWVSAQGLSEGLRLALRRIARDRRELVTRTQAHLQSMLAGDFEARLQALLQAAAGA